MALRRDSPFLERQKTRAARRSSPNSPNAKLQHASCHRLVSRANGHHATSSVTCGRGVRVSRGGRRRLRPRKSAPPRRAARRGARRVGARGAARLSLRRHKRRVREPPRETVARRADDVGSRRGAAWDHFGPGSQRRRGYDAKSPQTHRRRDSESATSEQFGHRAAKSTPRRLHYLERAAPGDTIELYVNSNGGDLTSGFAIVDRPSRKRRPMALAL